MNFDDLIKHLREVQKASDKFFTQAMLEGIYQ